MWRAAPAIMALIIGPLTPRETPEAVLTLLSTGITQAQEGEFESAVLTLDAVVRQVGSDPAHAKDLARAYTYLSVAYFGLGQHQIARAKIVEALKLDPATAFSDAEFPPKVLAFLEHAREEAKALLPAPPLARTTPPEINSAPEPGATIAKTPVEAPPKNGGKGRKVAIAVIGGGAAAAGVAVALGGGGGGGGGDVPSTTTPVAVLPPSSTVDTTTTTTTTTTTQRPSPTTTTTTTTTTPPTPTTTRPPARCSADQPAQWQTPSDGATVRASISLQCQPPPQPGGAPGNCSDRMVYEVTGEGGEKKFEAGRPWTVTWDTTEFRDGRVTLRCYSTDPQGNATSRTASIGVTVNNTTRN
jgi:hypothetical protein